MSPSASAASCTLGSSRSMDNDGIKFFGASSSLVELHILASDIGDVGWDCAIVKNGERERERKRNKGKKNGCCCNRSNRIYELFSRVTAFTEFVSQNAAKWMGWFRIDALTRASDGPLFSLLSIQAYAVIFNPIVMLNHYAGKIFHSESLLAYKIHAHPSTCIALVGCWARFSHMGVIQTFIWHKV